MKRNGLCSFLKASDTINLITRSLSLASILQRNKHPILNHHYVNHLKLFQSNRIDISKSSRDSQRIAESQNHRIHRMAEVRRDLCISPSQISPVKQGYRESVSQRAFEVLQRGTLHSLPVAVLSHTHWEEVFSDVHREPPMFPIMLIVSGLVTTKKNLSSLHTLFRCLAKLVRLLLSLVFTKLRSPRCFSFSSLVRCSSFLTSLFLFSKIYLSHPCLSCTAKPKTGYNTPGVVSAVLRRETGSLLLICWLYVV